MIRSRTDYGAAIYSTASTSTLKTINVIQNSALRLATGAFRTTPIDSLLSASAEWPPDYRRWFLLANFVVQSKASGFSLPELFLPSNPASTKLQQTVPVLFNNILTAINITKPQLITHKTAMFPPWKDNSVRLDLAIHKLWKENLPRRKNQERNYVTYAWI